MIYSVMAATGFRFMGLRSEVNQDNYTKIETKYEELQ